MSREAAIDVLDELVLRRQEASTAGRDLASAWRDGQAYIRDLGHAGGADSRIHITVVNNMDGRTYHVPACWDGQWVLDDPEGVTR
ncbi:MAG: hypothetical protein QM820_34170 [Minicystis sp.]